MLIFCNFLSIQLLWFKRFRESEFWLFMISIIVSLGMWLERFVIIVTSLNRDFLPTSWAMYTPTFWDLTMFIGHDRIFLYADIICSCGFCRSISIFEMRTLLPEAEVKGGQHGTAGDHDMNEIPSGAKDPI